MADRILGPKQRARYEKILRNKGQDAARAYRQKIKQQKTPTTTTKTTTAASTTGGKGNRFLKLWDAYQDARARGEGDKFLLEHENFARNIEKNDSTGGDTNSNVGDTIGETGGNNSTEDSTDLAAIQADLDEILKSGEQYADRFVDKYYDPTLEKRLQIDEGTSKDIQNLIDSLREYKERAGQYTGYEKSSLDMLKRAAEQGYSAPEVQAMREQGMDELNRQYLTAMREQAAAQRRGGVRGAAGAAQMQDLNIGRQTAAGNLERDLVIQNAETQQARKEAYGTAVRGTESTRASREATAQGMYAGAMTDEEMARRQREAYNRSIINNMANMKTQLGLTGLGTYTGLLSGQQGVNLAEQNLSSTEAMNEQLMDYWNRMAEQQAKMNKRYFNLAKQQSAGLY